jgi:crotonobetainyl-CoA:carnitine CoA-transferase CaiB-like acyl-CoA transferase
MADDTDALERGAPFLGGVRVVELADELGEYCGKVLAGLGADVIKVEPPEGEVTRRYGPFHEDRPGVESSLYHWHYNFGKRGVVLDLDDAADQEEFRRLVRSADVLLTSRPAAYLAERGLGAAALRAADDRLVVTRLTPFGDDGPWADYRGSDLVHLALGGVAMNCGYDPRPDGTYDLPPIAPQMWQAYHIAGEHAVMGTIAALIHREGGGPGQEVSVAVHQAVSTNTETDIPNWVYQRRPHHRQTCRHSMPNGSLPAIARTKDGRWLLPYRTYLPSAFFDSFAGNVRLLQKYGMDLDLTDERYADAANRTEAMNLYIGAATDRLVERFTLDADLWLEAQDQGLPWAPCRRPEENVAEEHWRLRETFLEVEHPELGQSFVEVGAKWYAPEAPWRRGPRAPMLGEHTDEVRAESARSRPRPARDAAVQPGRHALAGVRVIDLSWLLASGGGGRYLAAMGAEVIKVEHSDRIDAYRFGAGAAPDGGRAARDAATSPVDPAPDRGPDRGGAFMEINAGKRAVSLNLKTTRGRELLTDLLRSADVLVEGFSPGTMSRMGFGYDVLRRINPRLVYVQQSGMGEHGTYGRMRSYGPTAAAITGISEMSGMPEPFAPAGIGYSYLDWFGAYNIATAMFAGLYRLRVTGRGCWIDSSQAEAGLYLTGTAVLDHSANGRGWTRTGNRSPYKPAAPHGIYPVHGDDRWIAVSCFDDSDWEGLVRVLGRPQWASDPRFATLESRIAHADELDRLVATTTAGCGGADLMVALQAERVPAGVCQTAEDRCDADPQLSHLGWTVELDQTEIGRWPVREVPIRMSATPTHIGGTVGRSGPSYGEDNDYVLGEILGLGPSEIDTLRSDGVV